MTHATKLASLVPRRVRVGGWSALAAGGVAGLVAGAAYLAAQMAFSALLGSHGPLAALQRIGAILLGPDAVPPGHFLGTELMMGLLIHLPLSLVLGFAIGHWVRGLGVIGGALLGAIVALVFYFGAFFVVAPSVFPWFLEVRNAATAFDHVIFGVVAGSLAAHLQRPRQGDDA